METTHLVVKKEDIVKYCSEEQKKQLDNILQAIQQGRQKDGKNPANDYIICSTDEPYADAVAILIRKEDEKKLRKELGLPTRKQLVFYKSRYSKSPQLVKNFRIQSDHGCYRTVEVVLDNGEVVNVHEAYLRQMQSSSFTEDRRAEDNLL